MVGLKRNFVFFFFFATKITSGKRKKLLSHKQKFKRGEVRMFRAGRQSMKTDVNMIIYLFTEDEALEGKSGYTASSQP